MTDKFTSCDDCENEPTGIDYNSGVLCPRCPHFQLHIDSFTPKKPATITIGKREINAPIREGDEIPKVIYQMDLSTSVNYVVRTDPYYRDWAVKYGVAFRTPEDAIACSEAVIEMMREKQQ